MGFGLSGNDSSTYMVGGDAIIAGVDTTGYPFAVDYFLAGRHQVSIIFIERKLI